MVNSNHKLLRAILMLGYVLVICMIVFLISSLYSYFNSGADRSKILHTEIKKQTIYTPKITWKKDGNKGRKISEQTLNEIENDYLDAWYVQHIAYKTNTKIGIDDYFTKNARENIYAFIDENKKEKITIESTTLKHNTDLLFFSEDGQLAVLEDKNVIEYKQVFKDKKLILETAEISDYKLIILLEDGFWRIRHKIKQASKPYNFPPITVNVDSLVIKGINYYPQKTPWDMFGDAFEIETITNDFKIIKNAGLNSVRVFVPYEDFGKATVKNDKLEKLKLVLDSAEKEGLKVVLTLFDFYGNYDILDWTLTYKHASTIVSTFKNHPAILAWDLKNEPNLDFESRGKETVIAWLENLIVLIKSIDEKHPVTIGWSNIESATILKDKVDVVSFHYYEDLKDFEKSYQSLKKEIPNKPVVLQEFGVSSYSGFWWPFGLSEKEQATFHQEIQKVLTKNNLSFMSWTLYDFEEVPKEVVGKLPWRTNPQKRFGFITTEGIKKPSFKYIAK